MIRLVIATWVMSVALTTQVTAQSSISDFAGRWDGASIDMADQSIPPEKIGIDVNLVGDGYELAWNAFIRHRDGWTTKPIKARFVATNRQGVFEFAPDKGSFLDRVFASPITGNPLNGETVLWSRLDSNMLAVYSLSIDNAGRFDLDHYSWTKTENGLVMRFREQTETLGEEVLVQGRLVAKGK